MIDGLASLGAVVDDKAVAFTQSLLTRDQGCNVEEMPEYSFILWTGMLDLGQGLFGDDQDMDGCLGIDVRKGQTLVVFEEDLDRDLLAGNLTEDGIGTHRGSLIDAVSLLINVAQEVS